MYFARVLDTTQFQFLMVLQYNNAKYERSIELNGTCLRVTPISHKLLETRGTIIYSFCETKEQKKLLTLPLEYFIKCITDTTLDKTINVWIYRIVATLHTQYL